MDLACLAAPQYEVCRWFHSLCAWTASPEPLEHCLLAKAVATDLLDASHAPDSAFSEGPAREAERYSFHRP
jgi:hypothetical protein